MNIKHGNTGEAVKLLQGLLNLHGYFLKVDGSFGPALERTVKVFQYARGLEVDGKVGPKTWASLGVTWKNQTFIIKVPGKAFKKFEITNTKRKKFGPVAGYNFVINGGMFDTKSGVVVQDLVINGKVINGGNYSNKGIEIGKGFIYTETVLASKAKSNFVGGAPVLLPEEDTKGLSSSYLNQRTIWNMIGSDSDGNFYYMSSLNKCTMKSFKDFAKTVGAETLINLDGGGSRALCLGKDIILPTDGRGIPSLICLEVNL